MQIVDETSATLAGYEKILLNADHSEMCKFASEDDNNYRQVAGQLAKWCKDFSKPMNGGGSKVRVRLMLRFRYKGKADHVARRAGAMRSSRARITDSNSIQTLELRRTILA
jgi:hypothetical protein